MHSEETVGAAGKPSLCPEVRRRRNGQTSHRTSPNFDRQTFQPHTYTHISHRLTADRSDTHLTAQTAAEKTPSSDEGGNPLIKLMLSACSCPLLSCGVVFVVVVVVLCVCVCLCILIIENKCRGCLQCAAAVKMRLLALFAAVTCLR